MVEEGGTTVINTNSDDYVYALYNNECVGVAHTTEQGELYLTIHGSEAMTRKPIRFQLWKASNGKTYNLTTFDKTVGWSKWFAVNPAFPRNNPPFYIYQTPDEPVDDDDDEGDEGDE
jgi:hypothetical protein